jgi:hypothetical protein
MDVGWIARLFRRQAVEQRFDPQARQIQSGARNLKSFPASKNAFRTRKTNAPQAWSNN